MHSDLGWAPVCRLNFFLRSAPVVFSKVHENVYLIFGKIFFDIIFLLELEIPYTWPRNECVSSIKILLNCECFFPDRFHFLYFFALLDNFHFFWNFKTEVLFFYMNKNKHFYASVCFTGTSGFVGTVLLCTFNILSFSTKLRCWVHKHVFLFAKFTNTKLFGLIRANAKKEHEILSFLLIKFW